ncbi:acyltransferase family protein [Methyloligella halotolerans]|uniref:acyltransferase family protein n=1 Tax=Methyloligella halotolerans TaxID=1177755 RepID=UPI00083E1645|nr:acyltransferase [Methyloligella halotolerans]
MHYHSLDGLRGLAAVTVLLSHFTNKTGILGGLLGHGAGKIGVAVFFVLSGHLMARLYMERPLGTTDCFEFFRNRFARIAPLYFLAVFVAFAWTKMTGHSSPFYAVNDETILEHLLFVRGQNVLWTIPVEVQFYAVFPLIWWLYRATGRAVLLWMLLAGLGVALLGFPQTPVLLGYILFFFVGVATIFVPELRASRTLDAVFAGLLVLYVLSFPVIRGLFGLPLDSVKSIWTSPIYMLLISSLLVVSLYSSLAKHVFGNRVATYLGMISYSIYLLHFPILHALADTSLIRQPYLFLAIFLSLTLIVATASYFLYERPLRNLIRQGDSAAVIRQPNVETAP